MVSVASLCHCAVRMCVIDPQETVRVYLSAMCCRNAQQQVPNETKQSDELRLSGIE